MRDISREDGSKGIQLVLAVDEAIRDPHPGVLALVRLSLWQAGGAGFVVSLPHSNGHLPNNPMHDRPVIKTLRMPCSKSHLKFKLYGRVLMHYVVCVRTITWTCMELGGL